MLHPIIKGAFLVAICLVVYGSSFGQCSNTTVQAGADISSCGPASGQLAGNIITNLTSIPFIQWSPSAGLSNPNSLTSNYNVTSSTTYILSATLNDDLNLVFNGDFESGSTGFTSNYIPGTGGTWGLLSNPGTFAVNVNPNNTHTNFASCGDHTTGNGLMLIVNGASIPNQNVWCQTVAVNPNTLYNFSTWATSVVSGSPAILQFSINGSLLGSSFTLQSTTCIWQNFSAVWNSGSNTAATICIVNQNTAGGGNDFALDDISLTEVCVATDTITISIGNGGITMIDTTVCQGQSVFAAGQFQTTSGTYIDTIPTGTACDSLVVTDLEVVPDTLELGKDTAFCSGNDLLLDATTANASYLWQDNSIGATFLATSSGSYMVTVTVGGCVMTDTISVNISPVPEVELGADTSFCQGNFIMLDAQHPNAVYLWNDGSMQSMLQVTQSGSYSVEVSINSCKDSDTINVTVDPVPVVSISGPTEVCVGSDVLLEAAGGVDYQWSTGENTPDIQVLGLSSATYIVTASIGDCMDTGAISVEVLDSNSVQISGDSLGCSGDQLSLSADGTGNFEWSTGEVSSSILIMPLSSALYSVTASDGPCPPASDVWQVNIAPVVTLSIDSASPIAPGDTTQLNLSTNGDQFSWITDTDISCTDCPDPFVYPDSSTYYVISVWNNGFETCKLFDSVFVKVERECKGFMIPNAFTPNGDGLNDRFRPLPLDQISAQTHFTIWNRWGDQVFQSTEITSGWDGTYKGSNLPPGNYVYLFSYFCKNEPGKFQGTVTLLR